MINMKCDEVKLALLEFRAEDQSVPVDSESDSFDEKTPTSITPASLNDHLSRCQPCQMFSDQQKILQATFLTLPRPKATLSLKQRIIASREIHENQKNTANFSRKPTRRYLSIAAAISLTVLTTLLINLDYNSTQHTPTTVIAAQTTQSSISTEINRPSQVNFLVESSQGIDNVTFTLSLPPQMALYGYAGRQSLSWRGKLKQGKNLLTVPVIALTEQTGILVMKITHNDASKEYRVAVNVRKNRVLGPVLSPRNTTHQYT